LQLTSKNLKVTLKFILKLYNKITIFALILYRVKISALFVLTIILASVFGCSTSIELTSRVLNPQFKIQSLDSFIIAGINIADKKSVSELTNNEKSKLSKAFASRKLPSSFTLNILAKNPNDGSRGTKKMFVTLNSFNWLLSIDGRETVKGKLNEEIEIKSDTVFPLEINLNLDKYFPELSKSSMLDFVFSIKNNLGEFALKVKPLMETELGPLVTDSIIIVAKEFR
jgi:hypothetical protein